MTQMSEGQEEPCATPSLLDGYRVPREDMDPTWCVWCCHSHASGEVCGAEYVYVLAIGRDFCGCDADHHPQLQAIRP